MATPPNQRELVLDKGKVFVDVPRLMTAGELARVFEALLPKFAAGRLKGAKPPNPDPAAPIAADPAGFVSSPNENPAPGTMSATQMD